MAEPLRNGVYDRNDENPVTRPDLRAIDGGGETTAPQQGHLRAVEGGSDISQSGNQTASGRPNLRLIRGDEEAAAVNNDPASNENNERKLFNDSPESSPKKKTLRGRITKKRASIAGILIGGIMGGGFFGFSIIQGPMQLVHLGQLLDTFSMNSDNDANIRVTAWYRFARSGDFGETRIGGVSSKLFNHRIEVLRQAGITVRTDALSNIRSISFDTSKIPGLEGKSEAEARKILSEKYNIPENELRRINGSRVGSHTFNVSATGKSIATLRGYAANILTDATKGKVYNHITTRAGKKFWNLPSLFSPFKRFAGTKTSQWYGKRLDKKERAKEEKERQKRTARGAESTNPGAKERLKKTLQDNQGKLAFAGGALMVSGTVCYARNSADDVVEANRTAIVLPATLAAIDKTAIGSQVQANELNIEDAAAVVESFTDENGKTIWEGTALKSLGDPNFKVDPNKDDPNDLPIEYKQAFSNETTVSKLKENLGGNSAAMDAACSPVGMGIQMVGGLALLAAGPFTGGSTWGAFAAKVGSGAAMSYAYMQTVHKLIIGELSTDETVPTPLSGVLGGNLLAYGAREAANVTARSNGGIELSASESAAIDREQVIAAQTEFKNKSLATRLFDTSDYRSVASQVAMSISPSVSQNISSFGSGLLNISQNFSSIFSVFSPRADAADRAYQWDFPRYGIPKSIMNNPKYADPIENASIVAQVYDTAGGGYIDKAKKCFGVKITKDSGEWDALPENEINPNSQEYTNANCNDTSDELWVRTILFVFDTRYITAAACLELDDSAACNNTYATMGEGGTVGEVATSSGTAEEKVNVDDLGKNSSGIDCAPGTKDLGIVESRYTGEYKKESGPIKMRLCQVTNIPGSGNNKDGAEISGGVVVDARVSGAWNALALAAKADGINLEAGSSFRLADSCNGTGDGGACARPGQSAHQTGWAIDFGNGMYPHKGTSTSSCSGRARLPDNPAWKWLHDNAERFGFKQYSFEAWHWDPMPMENRCGKGE